MELKSVTEDDAEFLFELLKQREGRVNISHKSTPDWEEHLQYVKNHDYQSWDIIWIDETRVGNIYLSKKDENLMSTVNERHENQGFLVD